MYRSAKNPTKGGLKKQSDAFELEGNTYILLADFTSKYYIKFSY